MAASATLLGRGAVGSGSPRTVTVTVPAGADLLVCLHARSSTGTITGVTGAGGTAAAVARSSSAGSVPQTTDVWTVTGPTTGSVTISAAFSGTITNGEISVYAISGYGSLGTAATGAAQSTSFTAALSGLASGDVAITFVTENGANFAPAAGTTDYSVQDATNFAVAALRETGITGSYSRTWTSSFSRDYAYVAIPITASATTTAVSNSADVAWEGLATPASSSSSAWANLAPAQVSASAWWASLMAIAMARAAAWASLAAASATRSSAWEALGGTSVGRAGAWEAVGGIAKLSTSWWESQGVAATPVSHAVAVAWESLAGVAAPRAAGWEALAKATGLRVGVWEALQRATGSTGGAWEVLAAALAARSSSWEHLAPALALAAAAWEAGGTIPQPIARRVDLALRLAGVSLADGRTGTDINLATQAAGVNPADTRD